MARGFRRLRGATLALVVISLAIAAPASAKLGVTWMKGYAAPGTPARYDKVGVIKVGARSARNVLVRLALAGRLFSGGKIFGSPHQVVVRVHDL